MSSTTKVILDKQSDWNTWLAYVRIRASITDIWNLVDPKESIRPLSLLQPIQPTFSFPVDVQYWDPASSASFAFYKARVYIYRLELARYKDQQTAFLALVTFIQDSISIQNAVHIEGVDPHPWNILRALQQWFEMPDYANKQEIQAHYTKLCEGRPRHQDMETYVEEWRIMCARAENHSLGEATGNGAVRNFLLNIYDTDSNFARVHLTSFEESQIGLREVLKRYRWLRRYNAANKPESQVAYRIDRVKRNTNLLSHPQSKA